MSRKPHQPNDKDRATVKAMTGYGIRRNDVARVLGIHDDTLRKYYAEEMATAEVEVNAAVAQSLFWMATKGRNVAAAIFWMKSRCGWKEKLVLEGDADAPLRFVLIGEPEAKDATAWALQHSPK